ncbi:MAG: rhomboid family intramembrane serine protease [Ignavibacteriales bacterium]|nr:rhomboid family intramembrane serine protease [Ignavibacteriales bacterium]
MIPLRDINPTHRVPVVNVAIIVANVAAFLYELSLGPQLEGLFASYAVIPQQVSSAISGPPFHMAPILSLFSSMFLHGGFLHLGGNMLYLWIFGDNVEDKLGHGRFLLFYLLSGLIASAVHIVVDPLSTIPTVGASGAISGVLAAYLLMFPKARVVTVIPIFYFLQVTELPALVVLGMWFVLQFFNGFVSLGYETAGMGGVAWWAHIGGFVAGLVLVIPFRKFR